MKKYIKPIFEINKIFTENVLDVIVPSGEQKTFPGHDANFNGEVRDTTWTW